MVRVTGGALPYPSKCSVCGSSTKDCVDLGIDINDDRMPIDRFGAVLLCVDCFGEAAQAMDYISHDGLMQRIAAVETQIRAEYSGVESWYESLKRVKELNNGISAVLLDIADRGSASVSGFVADNSSDLLERESEFEGNSEPESQFSNDESGVSATSGSGTSIESDVEPAGQGYRIVGSEGFDDVSSRTGDDDGRVEFVEPPKRSRRKSNSDGQTSPEATSELLGGLDTILGNGDGAGFFDGPESPGITSLNL